MLDAATMRTAAVPTHLSRYGFEFDLVGEKLAPGTIRPVEPYHTLNGEGSFGVANPTFVAIKVLSPQADQGRIIVRSAI